MGPLHSDSRLHLTHQPSKLLLPQVQVYLSSHCSQLLHHSPDTLEVAYSCHLLVSPGKHSHGTANVPGLALWNLTCLSTLGFLSQRGKVKPHAPTTYFPNIIIFLVDNGLSFLFLLSRIYGGREVDTPFLFLPSRGKSFFSKRHCFPLFAGAIMAEREGVKKLYP